MNPFFSSGRCILTILLISALLAISASAFEAEKNHTGLINMSIPDSNPEVGDIIHIEGFINPAFLSWSGDKVLLQVVSPHESRADAYYQLKVNSDGTFRTELNADATGDWTFATSYKDYSSEKIPITVIPRKYKKETEITLTGPTSRLFSGDTAKMGGWLNDNEGNGVSFRQIWYKFGLPSYSCAICDDDNMRIWQNLGPVTTDETGYFRILFPLSDSGKYAVRASFQGDEIYSESESDTEYVQVF